MTAARIFILSPAPMVKMSGESPVLSEEFAELGDYINAPCAPILPAWGHDWPSGFHGDRIRLLLWSMKFWPWATLGSRNAVALRLRNRRKYSDIIMISHSMSMIKKHCDKGMVLVDGRLVIFDKVEQAI